jgi:hypothetical protein
VLVFWNQGPNEMSIMIDSDGTDMLPKSGNQVSVKVNVSGEKMFGVCDDRCRAQ